MADPVSIVVEIIDEYSDEIAELKAMLESIDLQDIDVDVDVDDSDITTTAAKWQALKRAMDDDIDVGINFDREGLGVHGDGPVGDFQSRMHGAMGSASLAEGGGRELVGGFGDARAQAIDPDRLDRMITPRAIRGLPIDGDVMQSAMAGRGMGGGMPFDFDFDMDALRSAQRMRRGRGIFQGLTGGVGRFRRFGKVLMEYKPDIMDWWNVLAVLLPLMIALGGAAIGLAAALGGVAIAAAGIVGIGLLGWGDSMQESMQNLRVEAQALRDDLFGVMQPAAGRFQPIMAEWMAGAPNQVAQVVDELEGLTVFEDGLERMGGGFIDWLEMVMATVVEMEPMITQLALRMGGAFGRLVHGVLSDMLQELYMNQEAYMDLGSAFLDIISIIFNLSKMVAFTVAQVAPLIAAVQTLTNLMTNRWVVALLTATLTLIGLDAALGAAFTAMTALRGATIASAGAWIASYVPALQTAIMSLHGYIAAATSARFATAALIATATAGLGLGAFAVGQGIQAAGSMSGPAAGAPGTRGGGGGTFVQINGDVREREMDRLMDTIDSRSNNQISVAKETGEL